MPSEAASSPPALATHSLSPDAAVAAVGSRREGLTPEEAALRLARDGANQLTARDEVHPLAILAGQFKSLIVWVLIIAAVVSGALGEIVDCIAILAIVVLNALLGFYQVMNAERSLAALRKMTAPVARVRRGGHVVEVPATDVVVGDILLLDAGDLVAADARLLRSASLRAIESPLTGESVPVTKEADAVLDAMAALADRINQVYLGTTIAAGTGEAVVVGTGMSTEIGRIASLLETAPEESTPLQRRLDALGRVLAWASLGIVVVLFVLGLMRGEAPLGLFLTAVSLAVAAVPEGLPAVVTVALALGVQRMVRRRALIRHLPAVETLGSTSVICTDKTGTLTMNQMTVRGAWTSGRFYDVAGDGYAPAGAVTIAGAAVSASSDRVLDALLTICAGCNGASLEQRDGEWVVIGDPTEGALLALAAKAGRPREAIERELPPLRELPFDSDRKRMSVIRRVGTEMMALVKGAPDVLLARCTRILTDSGERPLTEDDRRQVLGANTDFAGRALRVLAMARRTLASAEGWPDEIERDLTFVGLAAMYDPPRPEAREAVARCRSAGIRVIMITGDHPSTALAVAREIGIAIAGDRALSGAELDRLDDARLAHEARSVAVYARVTAEHKLRIVRAWRATGAVVAMTGDGVNDAPAIKGADIGVAMGRSGTEVTKEASDMVVTDDNFASIVAAVEEGRGIYDNIKKTLQYLLGGNTGELLLMTACVLSGLPTPLLPIHLLWINLVTDGLPALCLATDRVDPDVMARPPRPSTESMTTPRFFVAMVTTGILTAAVSMGVFLYGLGHETLEMARTHAFATLVFAELFRSFGVRSETRFVWEMGILSNLKLALVVAASIAFQIASHHLPWLGAFLHTGMMDVSDCVMLVLVSLVPLVVLEGVKAVRRLPHGRAHGQAAAAH